MQVMQTGNVLKKYTVMTSAMTAKFPFSGESRWTEEGEFHFPFHFSDVMKSHSEFVLRVEDISGISPGVSEDIRWKSEGSPPS